MSNADDNFHDIKGKIQSFRFHKKGPNGKASSLQALYSRDKTGVATQQPLLNSIRLKGAPPKVNEKNSFQIIAIMLRHCWLAADNNDGDDGNFDAQ